VKHIVRTNLAKDDVAFNCVTQVKGQALLLLPLLPHDRQWCCCTVLHCHPTRTSLLLGT
jgi:hypothetical protein